MKVYIEKSFIEKFEADRKSLHQSRLYNIIINYPQLELFIDFEYKVDPYNNNIQYETLMIYSKGTILPQQEKNIDSNWKNFSLIFANDTKIWFQDAIANGTLCFTFDNYEKKISEIINTFHYSIDLSETEFNWTKLKFITSSKKTRINDKYILVNNNTQKIDENLLPLLEQIGSNNKSKCVEIYTIAQDKKNDKNSATVQLKEKLKLLNSKFSNWKFNVLNIENYKKYDFHDRMIMNNLQLVECGKGFNLIPHKKSNSNIISNTIFDLFTYKRLKNLEKAHNECSKYLQFISSYSITKFPENLN